MMDMSDPDAEATAGAAPVLLDPLEPQVSDLGLGAPPMAPPPVRDLGGVDGLNGRAIGDHPTSKLGEILRLALGGLALGMRGGAGVGIAQGLSRAADQQRQDNYRQDQIARQQVAQEQERFQQDQLQYQRQVQQRGQMLSGALTHLSEALKSAPDKATADQYFDLYGQALAGAGFRDYGPDGLRRRLRYMSPDAKVVVRKQLGKLYENNKAKFDDGSAFAFVIEYVDPETGKRKRDTVARAIQDSDAPFLVEPGSSRIQPTSLDYNKPMTHAEQVGRVGKVARRIRQLVEQEQWNPEDATTQAVTEADAEEVEARRVEKAADLAARADENRAIRAERATERRIDRDERAAERLADGPKLRAVTSGDANKIADLNNSLIDLKTLTDTIDGVKGATGARAQIGAAVPSIVTSLTGWGVSAKQKQAVIDRVKQVIGKALEGGVLRAEDEIKYAKILPTIEDAPALVATKLEGLQRAITQRRDEQFSSLEDAGYDVTRFRARQSGVGSPDPNADIKKIFGVK